MAIQRNGELILKSFPKGAIVLLNGDINNNMLKYPQQCDYVRKDLHLIRCVLTEVQRSAVDSLAIDSLLPWNTTPGKQSVGLRSGCGSVLGEWERGE